MPSYTFPGSVANNATNWAVATLGTANLVGDIFEYDNSEGARPVLIAMHGYTEIASTLGADFYTRVAKLGFFVLGPQMRSRNSSTGTRDSSGQEVYDIYDIYQNVISKLATMGVIDSTKVLMSGYSGGGGNTYAFLNRFPDLCPAAVVHFGISDYGYDGTFSWYIQEASRQAQLDTDVGSPRASFLNANYFAYVTI